MLSSIRPQYTAAKRKVAKISRIQLSRTLRRDNPPSPKSFASPELTELPTPASEAPPVPNFDHQSADDDKDPDLYPGRESSEEQTDRFRETASSLPRVQLELTPGSLSDWSDVFNADKFNFVGTTADSLGLMRDEKPSTLDVSSQRTTTSSGGKVGTGNSSSTVNTDAKVVPEIGNRGRLMAGGHPQPTSNAKAINEAVGLQSISPTSRTTSEEEDSLLNASSIWNDTPNPAPAPLQIPFGGFGEVEFEGTLGDYSQMDALPRSPNSDTLTPVTGATLARALFGNAFHLSTHSSRPSTSTRRTSAVTRSDSAVLPDGDTPMSAFSDWRETLYSNGSISSPESHLHSDIPPVPPIPSHLVGNGRHVYATPPQAADTPFQDTKDNKSNTASLGSILASYVDGSPFITNFLNQHPPGDVDVRILRRISQIIDPPPGGFTLPSSSSINVPDSDNSTPAAIQSESSDNKPPAPPFSQNVLQTSSPPRPLPSINSHLSFTTNENEDNDRGDTYPSGSSRSRALSTPTSESWSSASRPGSPQSGLWNEQQDQRKRPKAAKVALGLTLSPNSQSGKVDWILNRGRSGSLGETSISRSVTLLPIGERRRSLLTSTPSIPHGPSSLKPPAPPSDPSKQNGQSATAPAHNSSASISDPTTTRLIPTSTRHVFNRQRAGSTPSPIAVDRISKDLDAFSITVAGGTAGLLTGPMFPETPRDLSPMWSANSISSPLRAEVNELLSTVSPSDRSKTTSFYAVGAGTASLAQQVLISRAATSVRGARLANNITRPRITAPSQPYPRNVSLLTPPPEDLSGEDAQRSPDQKKAESPTEMTLNQFQFPPQSEPSLGARSPTTSNAPPSPRTQNLPPSSNITLVPGFAANDTSSLNLTTKASNESLPRVVPPEALVVEKPLPGTPFQSPVNSRPSWQTFSEPNRVESLMPTPDTSTHPYPNEIPPSSPQRSLLSPTTVATPPTTSPPPSPVPSHQISPPTLQTPPSSTQPNSGRTDNSSSYMTHSFTLSLGAPPPYSSVVPEVDHNDTPMPMPVLDPPRTQDSENSSPNYSDFRSPPAAGATPPLTGDSLLSAESPSVRHTRSGRTRPRLPAGPRNPTSHATPSQRGEPAPVAGSSGTTSHPPSNASSFVPKFQSPPVKWRGYTLDVARWTFTSTQLQAIVSKAIRQSAEAYSIRLLPLEILENDIPDEMHRLEMLGTDVKTQYKAMCRKRQGLLQSLSAHMEGSSAADHATGLRLLNELAETSEASDRLAEELHSVDEQIANVRSLRDVHSASALAMALRKLNQSFQREVQATRALRQQVEYLESERDEAWKHAEEVANDFDEFTDKVVESNGLQMPASARSSSRRSSRVTAVRKSSVRALKAGLRPSRSQRSSVSSAYRASLSPMASGRMLSSSEDIPPVPPIPLPNPLGIETNLPSRSSMGVPSTGTPSSETRAMVKVQDELYALLGISPIGTAGLRRRHVSLTGPSEASDFSPASPAFDIKHRSKRPSNRPRSAGSAVVTL